MDAFCNGRLPELLRCCDYHCGCGTWLNRSSLLHFARSRGLEAEVAGELGRIRASVGRGPVTSAWEWAGLYFSHLAARAWLGVPYWSPFRWLLVALLLLGLVGNCVSLFAFRRLSRSGGRVYLLQVSIAATDLGSVLFGFFYVFAFFILGDHDPFAQDCILKTIAVILCTTSLLTSRWVFLGSILDRRQAFRSPVVYKNLDHHHRALLLSFLSFVFALLFCTFTMPDRNAWLDSVLNSAPRDYRICTTYTQEYVEYVAKLWPRCQGTQAFGYMWQSIGSTR